MPNRLNKLQAEPTIYDIITVGNYTIQLQTIRNEVCINILLGNMSIGLINVSAQMLITDEQVIAGFSPNDIAKFLNSAGIVCSYLHAADRVRISIGKTTFSTDLYNNFSVIVDTNNVTLFSDSGNYQVIDVHGTSTQYTTLLSGLSHVFQLVAKLS